jgi:hypothetical protein
MRPGGGTFASLRIQIAENAVAAAGIIRPMISLADLQVGLGHAAGVISLSGAAQMVGVLDAAQTVKIFW